MPTAGGHDGLYGPGDVTWRVNRETVLLAGGGRALLLQVAHPLVAAGVAEHSDYREDPWRRLYRTLDVTTRIVFGDAETSREAARGLRAVHARVRGVAGDGTPYDARDPELLLWVWATLVDTSLEVYTRYVRPLSPDERRRYCLEQRRFGEAVGIPAGRFPADDAELRGYVQRMVERELRVTEVGRDVARSTLRPPLPGPLGPAARPVGELLGLLTVGLLPERLRRDYGLAWDPARAALLRASTATVRRLLPLLPGLLREFPAARAASRRAA
ncbi:MAG: DUF2236 domain-containing protein [Actinobacteria bacterium]|nr:MAG: DUF2236 domain-containing protein [Actinomycetota bacterium]